jgi:hypothetical protein
LKSSDLADASNERTKNAAIPPASLNGRPEMPESKSAENGKSITRDEVAKLLNEDPSREYQAIITYVVYSQVLKGATYKMFGLDYR